MVVLVTVPKEEEAVKIAKTIVEEKLAGCVNIVRGVRSIYSWQGKIEDDSELLMVIKTKATVFKELETRVKELHSYTVPEIIGIELKEGYRGYLDWLDEVVK